MKSILVSIYDTSEAVCNAQIKNMIVSVSPPLLPPTCYSNGKKNSIF